MPILVHELESIGIANPIICSSINKAGFRMSGGKELYETTLKNKKIRVIAMQVLAGGSISANEAIEYVCSLPNIQSILFGASSKQHIIETRNLIDKYDQIYKQRLSL
jgi:predicted aldo/keto reductase-like oxidoreductase